MVSCAEKRENTAKNQNTAINSYKIDFEDFEEPLLSNLENELNNKTFIFENNTTSISNDKIKGHSFYINNENKNLNGSKLIKVKKTTDDETLLAINITFFETVDGHIAQYFNPGNFKVEDASDTEKAKQISKLIIELSFK